MNGKSPMGGLSLSTNREANNTLPAPENSSVHQIRYGNKTQARKNKETANSAMKKVEEVSEQASGADPTSRGG